MHRNELAQAVQEVTQNSLELAFVDWDYIGDNPEKDAKEAGLALIVVKLAEAKTGIINSKMHGFLSLA